MLERGLLVPVQQSLQTILEAATPPVKCRITTLCIPTCGRSNYLSRCVSSFAQNFRSHARGDATILVVDDSADQMSESRNRQVVDSVQTGDGPRLLFAGHKERQCLICALLRKSVAPPEVIHFALNAEKLLTTEGCVRNTMMLLTGGQYVMQADDDTFCAYASANSSQEHVTLCSEQDPYETYSFPDRESNLRQFPTDPDIHPFSIHESVLGSSLANVLRSAKQVSWVKVNPQEFCGPQLKDVRINLTMTGASGDPGMGSCFGFLTVSPQATLERIYLSLESYRLVTQSREVLRMVSELTISPRPIFMAMSFGIYNTQLQPPSFPLGRNLDGAFAHLCRLLDSRSLIGHLPFAISHLSEPNRCYSSRLADQVCRQQLTDLVQMCFLSAAYSREASLEQNLLSIGEQLVGLGSISGLSFRSFLRDKFVYTRFRLLEELRTMVSEGHCKHHKWLDQIDSFLETIQRAMLEEDNIIPTDLVSSVSSEEALAKTQSFVSMYGQLMLRWEISLTQPGTYAHHLGFCNHLWPDHNRLCP